MEDETTNSFMTSPATKFPEVRPHMMLRYRCSATELPLAPIRPNTKEVGKTSHRKRYGHHCSMLEQSMIFAT
jgi:hypothetical protein